MKQGTPPEGSKLCVTTALSSDRRFGSLHCCMCLFTRCLLPPGTRATHRNPGNLLYASLFRDKAPFLKGGIRTHKYRFCELLLVPLCGLTRYRLKRDSNPRFRGGEPRCFNHFSYSSVAVGTFGNTRHVWELNPAGVIGFPKHGCVCLCVHMIPSSFKKIVEKKLRTQKIISESASVSVF